jgi:hypothetical protein
VHRVECTISYDARGFGSIWARLEGPCCDVIVFGFCRLVMLGCLGFLLYLGFAGVFPLFPLFFFFFGFDVFFVYFMYG